MNCKIKATIFCITKDESTWDCPYHGSRFSPNGDVMEGPAYGCLEKIEVK